MKISEYGKWLLLFSLFLLSCNLWHWITEPEEPAGIRVSMDKSRYTAKDSIRVTLHNGTDKPVYLEGCNVFYLNTAVDTGWVVKAMRICVWEGYAQKVEPGKRFSETFPPGGYMTKGVHRFTVPTYYDCVDGKPISQAECGSKSIIIGPTFAVIP